MDAITNLLKIISDFVAELIRSVLGFSPLLAELVVMGLAAVVLITFAALSFMGLTYVERKVVARIQDRLGPNQAGPFGLLQPLADGIKMFTKEDTTPATADRWVYNLAPLVIAVFALATYAVIPFAPGVVGTNLNVGVFYVLAIGSGSIVAILMAGWGSNNKYALLGAFRTVAQLIGYEVPMLLNVLTVVLVTGSMSLIDIINHQTLAEGNPGIPHILMLPLPALVFLISGIAETARSPFDLLEAESEIVAGFHTEYSGMKFALFFLGEYVNALAVAFIFSTLFLGGYAGPILPPYVWILLKAALVFFVFMWLRGTLPRVRIDQMHALNWKFLVPMSTVNLVLVMLVLKLFPTSEAAAQTFGGILVTPWVQALILLAVNLAVLFVSLALAARAARRFRQAEEEMIMRRRSANLATARA
ncbi:MAG: NADH-quinone oxidoreductase subunit NuoH [Thermoflexales bacterium]|nr:NADH-quinone oxidoreductase subunit NuoH [Thermoflexales bacterium]MCS7323962.1 NADH-quinone oxidoreductase subunit NuoH [Thermoflexales bacterium]MCX7939479.1 NADH-quinone oxidoreductase subunit NuoH [Thermoflexales bacterium]MDW8053205.1 NADH-quinone oxidoreductase subunit NuoH [Anaerolineae bacterium]MDW8291856.1 NADH-quinone oxidoreductase subunit NuoH [Anaerolineae bacterium]